MVAKQLSGLLERVLGGFESADNHGIDDAVDLEVGEFSIQCLVMNLGKPTNHIVLRRRSFFRHVPTDVMFKLIKFGELSLGFRFR